MLINHQRNFVGSTLNGVRRETIPALGSQYKNGRIECINRKINRWKMPSKENAKMGRNDKN